MMLDEPASTYSAAGPRTTRLGLAGGGIDVEARTSYAELLALHAERRARTRGVVDALTDSELEQIRAAVRRPSGARSRRAQQQGMRSVGPSPH